MQLVQSIEKEQDTLSLRKRLAKEHGLTSIWEFIQGRAIVHKDNKRRIMNEQGEYMRDPSIKNLQYKKVDTSWPSCIGFSYEEWNMNGNGDFVRTEDDNTDIIQSRNWIFSAKDGIIIVVDSRSHSPSSRLYTTNWKRIPMPLWMEFHRFCLTDYNYTDEFSTLDQFCTQQEWPSKGSHINAYDRRKNIVWVGVIPVELSFKFQQDNYYNWLRKIEQRHNLSFNCSYTLMNTDGELLKTELWEYYVNNKKWFDGSNWLLPCIHGGLSDSTTWHNERLHNEQKRPVFYAVDMNGKVFRDEFQNVVMFDDPRWINSFDKEWYAPIVIDKKISPIPLWWNNPHPYTEYNAYICFINKEWIYRKDANRQKVSIIPFHKTIYDGGTVTSLDVKWYKLFPELGIIKVKQLSITEPWHSLKNEDVCKYYDYKWNEVEKSDYFDHAWQEIQLENISRWDTKERIYKLLSEDLIIYGYGTKIDHESPWWFNSYWWDAKIINRKMQFKNVQFSDGRDIFNYDFNYNFKKFWKSYIFSGNHIDPRWLSTYECVKINGLVAKYNKDDEWRELQWVHRIIKSLDDKYLFIQRWEGEDYYILNQNFQYIKDKNWEKLSFAHRPPFYVDGVFLYYNTADWKPMPCYDKTNMVVEKAYFADGTIIWSDLPTQPGMTDGIKITNRKIYKTLSK